MMEDDPRFDPVIRRYESVGGVWGWVAVVSSLLLIGFIILASWNKNIANARSGHCSNSTRRHGHLLVCGQTRCPPPNHGAGSTIRLVHPQRIHSERPLQKLLTACRSSMAPG